MFTHEGVVRARNSSEATANYWMMRAGELLDPKDRVFEAKLFNMPSSGAPSHDLSILHGKAMDTQPQDDLTKLVAARIALGHSIYSACFVDVTDPQHPKAEISLRTDYRPIETFAGLLEQLEHLGQLDERVVAALPGKTETVTYSDGAFVAEQGQLFTVIHGKFEVIQNRIVSARNIDPSEVVPFSSAPSI